MKKALAITVLGLIFSLSLLGLTRIVFADELKRFETLHEAAIYASIRLEACSHYYECSGVITQGPDGKYVNSPVRTDYASDSVRIYRRAPTGYRIVADIHSHPCIPNTHGGVFSDSDIITSITSRTVGYMVDLCTGDVHEFLPGRTRVDEVEVGADQFLTGGKTIGHVPAYPNDTKANEGF